MTQEHQITPPAKLILKWTSSLNGYAQAARWGADQELEACVKWIAYHPPVADDLRAARRLKPPSLKEQALDILQYPKDFWSEDEVDTIRRALEQLDD